jgi:hypothetical protein
LVELAALIHIFKTGAAQGKIEKGGVTLWTNMK